MTTASHIQRGQTAEILACRHLERQGLALISRNYRCRQGELDLIMRDKGYTVFVEVRCRNNTGFGTAAESVDWRKQQKLIAAATHYLQQNPALAQRPARFDVVTVTSSQESGKIQWIQDAFQAS